MSSPEPAKEPDQPRELRTSNDVPVPAKIDKRLRYLYWDIAPSVLILAIVNVSCLGLTYSFFPCLSISIICILMLLVPGIFWGVVRLNPINSGLKRVTRLTFLALISVFPFGMCVI